MASTEELLAALDERLLEGIKGKATPEGVAYATTRTVVFSSLAVLAMDFILTAMMFSTS